MPITASLGALTYSRVLKPNDSWYLQFISEQNLVDIELNSNRLYVMLQEDVVRPEYFSVLSMLMPYNPAIIWQTNFYSPNFPTFSANATQTTTLFDLILIDQNNSNFPIGSPIRFSGSLFGGVAANTTYYVHSYTGSNYISISTTPTGSKFNLTDATGSMTVSRWFGGLTPEDWISSSFRIRYNPYNNRIYALNGIRTFVNTYANEVGFPALINSFDKTTGNLQTSYVDLSNETTVLYSNFTKWPLDITFIDANNYVTINSFNTQTPTSQATQCLAKIQNNTTQVFQKIIFGYNASGSLAGPGYVTLDSNGDIISVNNILSQYSVLPTYSTNVVTITKSNPTSGNVIWQRNFGFQNIFPATIPLPQNFSDAAIDSSDNLYIAFQETREFAPTNTLGGFIVKLDNSNNIVWERHIDNIQIKGIDIDSTGNLYVVGSKDGGLSPPPQVPLPDSTIIAKVDYNGNLIWSNELNAYGPGNVGAVVSNFVGSRIVVDNDDNLVVAGNIVITAVGTYGFITRLPADGSIPASGTYTIDVPSNPYTLTYQTIVSNTNTYSFVTSTANTTGNSISSTLSSFTPGAITTDKSDTKITILV